MEPLIFFFWVLLQVPFPAPNNLINFEFFFLLLPMFLQIWLTCQLHIVQSNFQKFMIAKRLKKSNGQIHILWQTDFISAMLASSKHYQNCHEFLTILKLNIFCKSICFCIMVEIVAHYIISASKKGSSLASRTLSQTTKPKLSYKQKHSY